MNHFDLANIRPLNNFILVKTQRENDEWVGNSGIKLKIDTSYEVEKHAATTGEVIAVPSELRYPNKSGMYPLDYDVDMDVKVGDKIFFGFLCTSAAKPGSYFEIETKEKGKEQYYFIPYSEVKSVERDGVPIPANGYVIVEPIEEASFDSEIIIQPFKDKESERRGIVRFLGAVVREYRLYIKDGLKDGDDLNVGDEVLFKDIEAIPMEYPLHAKFQGGDKTYYRMHRKDIYYRTNAV